MKVTNRIEEETYSVKQAILLRSSGSRSIASIHPIHTSARGVPEIGAGALMTKDCLEQLVTKLTPEKSMSFLASNVLAQGVEGVMWWRPPSVEMLWFNTNEGDDKIGARCGRVSLPGLIFVASPSGLSVFAVKGEERPTADTELFQTPFYNVYEDGKICRGNAEFPDDCTTQSIPQFEKGFFQSRFTHPNIHFKKRLTKYRGGAGALWRSLLSGRRKQFPQDSLVPLGITVGKWIDRFTGKGRTWA